jgi:hypothetical protein
MIYQHVHTEPPPLELLDPKCPSGLRSLIHRCLQKDPAARYADPDALLKAIAAARKNLDPTPTSKKMTVPAAPERTSFRWLMPLAVLALLAVGFVAWKGKSPSRSEIAADFDRAYQLALGVGDPALAMRIAERQKGLDSKEYREAERRERELRILPMEERARDRIAARDWAGAAVAYQSLEALIEPDRAGEIAAALHFCRLLAKAADLEAKADWSGAFGIYSGLQSEKAPLQSYLLDCLRRVRERLNAASQR